MKRFFGLAVAAVMLGTFSAVQAQVMCLYDSGECWPAASASDCNGSWGWVFNGGTQSSASGDKTYCSGGTYDQAATTNRKNTPLPSANDVLLGCCYWASSSTYAAMYTTSGAADCASGLNSYWQGTACGPAEAGSDALTRPSGNATYDGGALTVLGYCKWAEDNPNGDCRPVTEAEKAANCQTGLNTYWASPKAPPAGSADGTCPTSTPDHDGGSIVVLGCCKWAETGKCYAITTQEELADCQDGVNTFFSGDCPAGAGVCPGGDGVRLVGKVTNTPGLRVSYAKNRVIVNWTPAAKVSGGTIQLINAKGAVLSTAFIRGSGGKVTAKLGTVGVPAGMYFVHINAVGQNGQKIVSQSAVSVVK